MLTQSEALEIQLGILAKALSIVLAKRKDYSGDGDPFRNLRVAEMLGVSPIVGCLIRESDKNSRIVSLLSDLELAAQGGRVGESLLDTFADKINYTCIEAGLYAELDPKFKKQVRKLAADLYSLISEIDNGSY